METKELSEMLAYFELNVQSIGRYIYTNLSPHGAYVFHFERWTATEEMVRLKYRQMVYLNGKFASMLTGESTLDGSQ